jgi:SRSO17 transposase
MNLEGTDASLPIAYRLYLPEEWAKDAAHICKILRNLAKMLV